jgi:hypothetical protein
MVGAVRWRYSGVSLQALEAALAVRPCVETLGGDGWWFWRLLQHEAAGLLAVQQGLMLQGRPGDMGGQGQGHFLWPEGLCLLAPVFCQDLQAADHQNPPEAACQQAGAQCSALPGVPLPPAALICCRLARDPRWWRQQAACTSGKSTGW